MKNENLQFSQNRYDTVDTDGFIGLGKKCWCG